MYVIIKKIKKEMLKMKLKRIISVFISILMLISVIIPGNRIAASSATERIDIILWSPNKLSNYSYDTIYRLNTICDGKHYATYSSFGEYSLNEIKQKQDLSSLDMIMIFEPETTISSEDLDLLSDFLDNGIHVLFVGESSTASNFSNQNICTAAKLLGFNISFDETRELLYNFSIKNFPVSSFFINAKEFKFGGASVISETDNATDILSYGNDVLFAAKKINKGYIGVLTDSNFFDLTSKSDIEYFLYNIKENLKHNFDITVIPPTCLNKGYTLYSCTECNSASSDRPTDSLGHDIVWNAVIETTCTTDGIYQIGCSRCDAENFVIPINAAAYPQSSHNYSNNLDRKYGFTYKGATKLVLTFSRYTKFETLYDYLYIYDSKGNLIGKYTGNSLASHVMTIEGDSFTMRLISDSSINYYGFSFSKIEAHMNSEDSRIIDPATGHNEVVSPAVDATCTENGLTQGIICSLCGEIFVEQTPIDSLGHTEENLEGKEATCTDSGLTTGVKCSICDEILVPQNTIAAKGHTSVIIPGKEPTCYEDGYSEKIICTVCDEVLTESYVLPAEHSRTIVKGKAPTCCETGLTDGVKCINCNITLVEQTVIEKIEHYDDNKDGYCDVCSTIVDQSIVESNCNCRCHSNNIWFKIVLFFQKLFGLNKHCVCGSAHY